MVWEISKYGDADEVSLRLWAPRLDAFSDKDTDQVTRKIRKPKIDKLLSDWLCFDCRVRPASLELAAFCFVENLISPDHVSINPQTIHFQRVWRISAISARTQIKSKA
jgi:hypothetical protein